MWYTMDKVPETASNVLPSFTSPKSVSRMLAPYSNQTKIEKHSKISNTHHKHNPHNSPALSPPHTRSVLHSLPSMARADAQTMSCYGLPSKNTPSMWWYVQYCVAVKHAVVQSAKLLSLWDFLLGSGMGGWWHTNTVHRRERRVVVSGDMEKRALYGVCVCGDDMPPPIELCYVHTCTSHFKYIVSVHVHLHVHVCVCTVYMYSTFHYTSTCTVVPLLRGHPVVLNQRGLLRWWGM